MKTIIRILIIATMLASEACKKETAEMVTPPAPVGPVDNYSSIQDFYAHNSVPLQTYSIDAVSGGSFTSPAGTYITIPANSFTTMAGGSVSGSVTIQFKDIYKKSDMLLSNKPTQLFWGGTLKSGGEFFIKASQNNNALKLAANKKINVQQPAEAAGAPVDTAMQAMAAANDTIGGGGIGWNNVNVVLWQPTPNASLLYNTSGYIFSLYNFSNPADSGTWCNSDNPTYFSAYPNSVLTLHPTDNPMTFQMDVFLVFKNVNCMVHVYYNTTTEFIYPYSPAGLECTVVAIGIKDGKLHSSFTPLTISSSAQTVNFTLSETTTEAFKAQLNALN